MKEDETEGRTDKKARTEKTKARLSPSSRGEFDFIERIRRRAYNQFAGHSPDSSLGTHRSSLLLGIGDDAAVIRQPGGYDSVITADLLVEEIDFRLETTTPWLLGHKALAVSLSDIAAMGARPRFALLSIGIPSEIWNSSFADKLYEGYFALAEQYNVALIGGDISRSPDRVVIDSIVLGETRSGLAVFRRGASPGDHIFVTGALAGAAAGLRLLERGARLRRRPPRSPHHQSIEQLLLRQLRPRPRLAWGALLGEEGLASAMIDISDGLSSDLTHLCRESRTGARLDASRIPIDPHVVNLCGRRALDPLLLALHGGEDFELLFTVRPRDLRRLPRQIGGAAVTYIGDVTADEGRILLSENSRAWTLSPGGYSHFGRTR